MEEIVAVDGAVVDDGVVVDLTRIKPKQTQQLRYFEIADQWDVLPVLPQTEKLLRKSFDCEDAAVEALLDGSVVVDDVAVVEATRELLPLALKTKHVANDPEIHQHYLLLFLAILLDDLPYLFRRSHRIYHHHHHVLLLLLLRVLVQFPPNQTKGEVVVPPNLEIMKVRPQFHLLRQLFLHLHYGCHECASSDCCCCCC